MMEELNYNKSKSKLTLWFVTFGVLLLLIDGWVLFQVLKLNNAAVIDENSLVENIQVLAYASAGVMLLLNVMRLEKLERWMNLFFGVTCISFVLRELDVEDLNVPDVFIILGSGKGRNVMFIVIFVAIFYVFFKSYRYALSSFKKLTGSPVVQVCLVGCFFLILGAVGDENDMELFEEVCEMNGALMIALSALILVLKPHLLMNYINVPSEVED